MSNQVNKLVHVTYDDFKNLDTIYEYQFDQNNKDLVTKLDELVGEYNKLASDMGTMTQISVNQLISDLQTLINNHKTSSDHDARYYTKEQLDPRLRGGDTAIRREVFTIVNGNDGNGHFTYTDSNNVTITGNLTVEGYQIFTLQKGTYTPGENKMNAIINDTLHRDAAGGGLVEIDTTHTALTAPMGAGAKISLEYFERVGLMGEHANTHEVGGTDEIIGLVYISSTPPTNPKEGQIWLDTSV